MKINNILLILIIVLHSLLISCRKDKNIDPDDLKFEKITNSFKNWWSYHNENIDLESEFIAYDIHLNEISNDLFFKEILNNNFIPVKLDNNDEQTSYKLLEINHSNIDKSILKTIKQEARQTLFFKNFQGKFFPDFSFTDLNNDLYTSENVRNKTIILKTWFINCKPCLAEFPELNRLVDKYKNRDDLLFISLSLDTRESLKQFLSKTKFNYIVIPEQRELITKTLGLKSFPTHIIIDKKRYNKKSRFYKSGLSIPQ